MRQDPLFVTVEQEGRVQELTFYQFFGVSEDVSADDLKRQYRRICMQTHPDRNPGNTTKEDVFKMAQTVWQVLGDPRRRADYDARLKAHRNPQPQIIGFTFTVYSWGGGSTGSSTGF